MSLRQGAGGAADGAVLAGVQKGELVTAPHFEERLFQVVVHGSLVIYFIRDDGARYSLSSGEADYILGDMDLFLPSTGSIYTEAAEPLLCLALSLDQNRETLLASNSFLRLICGSLTAKMAAITALDAAPGSLTDRVLSYMRFKCRGASFGAWNENPFPCAAASGGYSALSPAGCGGQGRSDRQKAPIACSPDRRRSGKPPLARPANKKRSPRTLFVRDDLGAAWQSKSKRIFPRRSCGGEGESSSDIPTSAAEGARGRPPGTRPFLQGIVCYACWRG